jgi:hypothetical protein
MGVADLLIADPLTRGRAIAGQLLTQQRRMLDLVDYAQNLCAEVLMPISPECRATASRLSQCHRPDI